MIVDWMVAVTIGDGIFEKMIVVQSQVLELFSWTRRPRKLASTPLHLRVQERVGFRLCL